MFSFPPTLKETHLPATEGLGSRLWTHSPPSQNNMIIWPGETGNDQWPQLVTQRLAWETKQRLCAEGAAREPQECETETLFKDHF